MFPSITGKLQPRIAADARAGKTDYLDDQIWELALGQKDEPAISMQTRYGGRVGLARLVPLFSIGSRSIFETQSFASPVQITAIAPDAVQVEAEVVDGLHLKLFIHALDSHILGGQISLKNNTKQAMSVRAEVYAQAMREQHEIKMSLLTLRTPDQGHTVALSMGQIGNLHPILMMNAAESTDRAKLSTPLQIAANNTVTVYFVHVGLPDMNQGVEHAYDVLEKDWLHEMNAVNQRRQNLIALDTENGHLDAAILFSQQVALQSLIGATNNLPHPSPVYVRIPSFGFSANGTGSDHPRGWNSQHALDMYQLVTNLLVIEPELAKGIIGNYLSRIDKNGFIDAAPGAAGQKAGYLLPPLLAQLTALIYRHTGDNEFVAKVFPSLSLFYERWFSAEADGDQDGFPEWQNPQQANHEYHPIFSSTSHPLISADIRLVESPDLAAYLLREGEALAYLAPIAGNKKWKLPAAHQKLAKALGEAWSEDRFFYRDRDTHLSPASQSIFKGKGDQQMPQPVTLDQPNRLILRAEGGVSHRPNLRATITGLDHKGQSVSETLENEQFGWYRSRGAATTQTVWQHIDQIQVEGLSRVYEFEALTLDLTPHDLSLLLPYTLNSASKDSRATMLKQMRDDYERDYGLTSLPANQAKADPAAQRVILPWVSMLGVAMIEAGEGRASYDFFERVAAAPVKNLIEQGQFFQWYNAVTGEGLGQAGHATGIVPLYWLMRLIGVWVLDAHTVEITGEFAMKKRVQMTQYGVKIARSSRKLAIKFPNGRSIELPADAKPQVVTDKK